MNLRNLVRREVETTGLTSGHITPAQIEDNVIDAAQQLAECAYAAGYSKDVVEGLLGEIRHGTRQLATFVGESHAIIEEWKRIAHDFQQKMAEAIEAKDKAERETEVFVEAALLLQDEVADLTATLNELEPTIANQMLDKIASELGVSEDVLLGVIEGDQTAVKYLLMSIAEAA